MPASAPAESLLIAFLRARLDEATAAAIPGRDALDELRFGLKQGDLYEQHLASRIEDGLDIVSAAWEARLLREVAALRELVDWAETYWADGHDAEGGLRLLAQAARQVLQRTAAIYSDHPDYRQEWALPA